MAVSFLSLLTNCEGWIDQWEAYWPKCGARFDQCAVKGLVDATRLARGAFTKMICQSFFLAKPKPFSYPKRAVRIALSAAYCHERSVLPWAQRIDQKLLPLPPWTQHQITSKSIKKPGTKKYRYTQIQPFMTWKLLKLENLLWKRSSWTCWVM